MKILITGGTGFVGRNLLGSISRTEDVCLVVRNIKQARMLLGKRYKYISTAGRKYKEQIEKFNPELVIHLASYLTSGQDTSDLKRLLDSNIVSCSLLLDALSKCNVRYFVNVGSFSEYYQGAPELNPAYLYSATKIAFRSILDFYSKNNDFKVVQVVPYTIYGANDTRKKVIDHVIDATRSCDPIPMTEGNQVLDFIHISDVVDFFLALIRDIRTIRNHYSEYYLGTGVGTSLREIAKMVENITGKKPKIHWGVLPYRKRDIMTAVAPVGNNDEGIVWAPQVSLHNGLRRIIEGEQNVYHNNSTIPLSA